MCADSVVILEDGSVMNLKELLRWETSDFPRFKISTFSSSKAPLQLP